MIAELIASRISSCRNATAWPVETIIRLETLTKKLESFAAKPLLVDSAGLAGLFTCSKRHIARMRAASELPDPLKLGGSNKVVWRMSDIEALVFLAIVALKVALAGGNSDILLPLASPGSKSLP